MNQLTGEPTRRLGDAEPSAKVTPSTLAIGEPTTPKAAGSEPDYSALPGCEPPKFQPTERHPRLAVSWLQAH
jgi:hypothetical protein